MIKWSRRSGIAAGPEDADAPTVNPRRNRRKRPLHIAVLLLAALLALYIVVLLVSGEPALGAKLSVAFACSAVGGMLGFIFAIPKRDSEAVRLPNKDRDDPGSPDALAGAASLSSAGSSRYRPNTSLEEISDWLTKIIVGLGLVQAAEIGQFIEDQGTAIAPVLFGADTPAIVGSAMLVASTIIAFLASFLYFRLYLAEEFTRSDLDAMLAQRSFEVARSHGRTQQLGPKPALETIIQSEVLPVAEAHAGEAMPAHQSESGPAEDPGAGASPDGAAAKDDEEDRVVPPAADTTAHEAAPEVPGLSDPEDARSRAKAATNAASRKAKLVRELPATAISRGGFGPTGRLMIAIERKLGQLRHPLDPSDPAKGLFGGRSIVTTPGLRMLSARVTRDTRDGDWFRIQLSVTSADPPLRDDVAFFYHPTFETPFERVRVAKGEAHVQLYAYGAFTVGVLADGGATELELDLAQLESAPAEFRER